MTEYDFSPAAYEKYLETQSRIARWVDKTRRYTPSNPFVPATPAVRSTPLDDAQADYHQDSTGSDRRHRYYSSKHKHRRNSSEPPSTAKPKRYSTSKSTHPPQMPPVRRSTAPHPGVVILAPQHPVPSRPVRSKTTPVYSYPYPLERNTYSSYPNPVIPYTDVRSNDHHPSPRSKDSSSKNGSLLKRLFSGIIGKGSRDHGEKVRARGKRRYST